MLLIDHPAPVILRRLLRVRLMLMLSFLLLLWPAHWFLAQALPLIPLTAVVVALLAVSALTWMRLRWLAWPVRELEIGLQLVVDMLGITAILYFTGGWTNPLVSIFLVPIAVAVVTLPAAMVWCISALALICYTLLTVFHLPFESFVPQAAADLGAQHDHHLMHQAAGQGFSLHLFGMWLTFVLSAGLITYFGVTLAATLRARVQAMARLREENLRNEQIMGVATLAAGTAHELGTPLSNIALISNELRAQARPEQREDLDLLHQQVATCREILGRLRAAASTGAGEAAPVHQSVAAFIADLQGRWEVLRPRAVTGFQVQSNPPGPTIRAEPTLTQALLNLLNNAADASPGQVDVEVHWDDAQLLVDIRDRGPGFSAQALARVTDPVVDAGQGGMGIGLILANATIERFGGRVQVANRADGGAWVRVQLPLGPIQAVPS